VRIANSRGPETLADLAKGDRRDGGIGRRCRQAVRCADYLGPIEGYPAIFRPIYSMARATTSSWSTLATTIPCVTDA